MLHQLSDESCPASSRTSTSSRGLNPMRIFLVQTAKGLFSSSGGYKANIFLLRHLASRGHEVRQLCYCNPGEAETYIHSMAKDNGYDPLVRKTLLHLRDGNGGSGTDVTVTRFTMDDGVQVLALDSTAFDTAFGGKKVMHKTVAKESGIYIENKNSSPRLQDFISFLQQEVAQFSPTHIISNDGLTMKATSALEMPTLIACRVGIIHTAEQLPFGPFSEASSPKELELLQTLDGLWSVSDAIKQYALHHGKLGSKFLVHHPWTYLEEKSHTLPSHLHNWNKKYIGMINPCAVKGLPILIQLAKERPQYEFLVYQSWGYNEEIAKQLEGLGNITIRTSCKNMEMAWRDIKVLLVPSLWFEAWGIVLIEAHLHGIPVIASTSGALSETMRGLDYSVPVNPIAGERDDEGSYILPEQDVGPWVKALDKLMTDRSDYLRLSYQVRTKTEQWLNDLDELAHENWLLDMMDKAEKRIIIS